MMTSKKSTLLHQGLELQRRGNPHGAIALYQRLLASDPGQFDALHLQGLCWLQLGQPDKALPLVSAAIRQRPQEGSFYNSRGTALQQLRRLDEASADFERALKLQPGNAGAHYNHGLALLGLDRAEAALEAFDKVIALRPDNADAHNSRGVALQSLGRHHESLASFEQAIALRPDFAAAYVNRGNSQEHNGDLGNALLSFERAIALCPREASLHINRGNVLKALGRKEDALADYAQAIALKPDYAEAHNNLGDLLRRMGQLEPALRSAERAIALKPDFREAHAIRGAVLSALGRHEEALASFEQALRLEPRLAEAHNNRACELEQLERHSEALEAYDSAIALQPDYVEALLNKGYLKLRLGQFAQGWALHEWRWRPGEGRKAMLVTHKPLWLGTGKIAGRTILVHAEQGLGDSIQFCRYAVVLADRGARVILDVPAKLQPLLATLDPRIEVVASGQPIPRFDCHCPMMSLPLACGGLPQIPNRVPYLRADPALRRQWSQRLGPRRLPRVGLVWSGNPDHKNDRNRSMTLQAMLPLEHAAVELISLQKDVRARDLAALSQSRIRTFAEDLKDFADTAALVAELDLVVSVDTAVAHLSGALGRPTWLLLSRPAEWRWLVGRDDTPWYPTMRLFKQQGPGGWDPVIAAVAGALGTAGLAQEASA